MAADHLLESDKRPGLDEQLMGELLTSPNYQMVFGRDGEQPPRQYSRILERAQNPNIPTLETWNQGVGTIVDLVLTGVKMSNLLDRGVIFELYQADRHAWIRARNAFFNRVHVKEAAEQLRQERERILQGTIPDFVRGFYRGFEREVIEQRILGGGVPAVIS